MSQGSTVNWGKHEESGGAMREVLSAQEWSSHRVGPDTDPRHTRFHPRDHRAQMDTEHLSFYINVCVCGLNPVLLACPPLTGNPDTGPAHGRWKLYLPRQPVQNLAPQVLWASSAGTLLGVPTPCFVLDTSRLCIISLISQVLDNCSVFPDQGHGAEPLHHSCTALLSSTKCLTRGRHFPPPPT